MIGSVAIVKDEIDNIDRILAWPRPLTICDTGSGDGTAEALTERGVTVHHVPFVNFGQARSEAFRLACGTADWLLALDADMDVEIDPDFEPDPSVDAYMIRMGSADFEYRLPLLIRGDLPWQSRGAVHEYTCLPDQSYVGVPTDQVRVRYADDRSSVAKSEWQLGLLVAELAERPDDPRTVFYAAQTLMDLGRADEARTLYERRSQMAGFDEETFYAKYRLALLVPWPERIAALIEAWEYRPSRLEPVYEIVRELNLRGQHRTALQLARVEVCQPPDRLFIHAAVYRWGLAFERSIAEWHCGSRDTFAELSSGLLADPGTPDHIREAVARNLAL